MKSLLLDTYRIAYTETGQGQPLVLLHANPGSHQDFAAIVPQLAETYRVFALDWPGYGESPAVQPPQATTAFIYADILQQFIMELNITNAILVGNSVGGYAAVCAALDMPERVAKLILVSPGGFTAHTAVTRLFCRLQGREWMTRLSVVSFAKFYLHKHTAVTQAILQRAATTQRTKTAVAVNAAIWRSFTHPAHDLRARAGSIQCPTLVISGQHDPVIPAHKDGKIAATTIPHARQVILDTGHEPFAEDPAGFLTAVEAFFRENTPLREPRLERRQ